MTKSNAALTGKGEQRCDREGAAVATQLHRDARLVGAGAAEEIASLDPVAYPNLQCGKMSDEGRTAGAVIDDHDAAIRSEEHTSELQSLMRNSYAVFRLKKKK